LYDNKPSKKRAWQFYYLGLSIGNLLTTESTTEFIRALSVLLVEFENETESNDRRINPFANIGMDKKQEDELMVQARENYAQTGQYTYFLTPDTVSKWLLS
jgi:hypothetical protein